MNISVSAHGLTLAIAALLLASCGTSTLPTATDMDRFYAKAEQLAQDHIATLDAKKRRGEITQAEYESQASAIRGRIANHATELAWARHESMDAQRRAMGIPTGGHPVQVTVPGAGGIGSFYHRAGEAGGSSEYNTPYGGSVLGGPNRGERPVLPEPTPQPQQSEPIPDSAPVPGM